MTFVLNLTRPIFNKEKNLYVSEISFSSVFSIPSPVSEEGVSKIIDTFKDQIISFLLMETKSWFSKPIQERFLRDRLNFFIPMNTLPADFDGTSTWRFHRLEFAKDKFTLIAEVQDIHESEKICLDDEDELNEIDDLPFTQANEPIGIGPTRRQLVKEKVMKERAKAAKALFRAERMTQQYYAKYGDTDWEDSDEDSGEDSEDSE
jgi:hypothetical protein